MLAYCLKWRCKRRNDEMTALEHPPRSRTRPEPHSARQAVTIGLVNNMGDEALKVTERQFGRLVSMSAGDIDVQLRLFAFGTDAALAPRIGVRYRAL